MDLSNDHQISISPTSSPASSPPFETFPGVSSEIQNTVFHSTKAHHPPKVSYLILPIPPSNLLLLLARSLLLLFLLLLFLLVGVRPLARPTPLRARQIPRLDCGEPAPDASSSCGAAFVRVAGVGAPAGVGCVPLYAHFWGGVLLGRPWMGWDVLGGV